MLQAISKYTQDVSILRRLLFAVAYLPSDFPNLWEVAVEFATQGKQTQDKLTAENAKMLMENIQELDNLAFCTDRHLLEELIYTGGHMNKPLGIILMSQNDKCIQCGSKLQLRKDRPASIIIYDVQMGTVPGSHYHKTCSNRLCGATQFYGYTSGGHTKEVHFNPNWEALPYFVSSRESAFSMKLLRQFNSEILIGQMSFQQCAESYNYLHTLSAPTQGMAQEKRTLHERQLLDRRRAESAYFQYAVLKVASWYPQLFDLEDLPLHNSLSNTLLNVTSTYHGAFMETYAGHRCDVAGCGHTIVIDGNMKNYRDVCFAVNAGYVEYKGLPGRVRTGCQNTPQYLSRYCGVHNPVVAIPQNIQLDDVPKPSTSASREDQVGLIVNKRVTRRSTLYEVVWLGRPLAESTWELASSLPKSIVQDYESGIQHDVCHLSTTSGGQTVSTVSTTRKQQKEQTTPQSKKICRDFDTSNNGIFEISEDKVELVCNTEKDRVRVNNRTAGIVAGAWPCGTVVMLAELYGAESKAQVYGALHTFLQENKDATASLRFICYDDSCHLKKYACNPVRRSCTPTSECLASLNFVIDKFHFKGHVDPWYHQHCSPHQFTELNQVDTETCEQLFSWLSRYSRITRHMNREHFLFYVLYLCDS